MRHDSKALIGVSCFGNMVAHFAKQWDVYAIQRGFFTYKWMDKYCIHSPLELLLSHGRFHIMKPQERCRNKFLSSASSYFFGVISLIFNHIQCIAGLICFLYSASAIPPNDSAIFLLEVPSQTPTQPSILLKCMNCFNCTFAPWAVSFFDPDAKFEFPCF